MLAATLAFGAIAAMWSVLLPLGESPDEPAHLDLVLTLAAGHPYPAYDGLSQSVATERLCRTYAAAVRVCPVGGETVTATAVRRHLDGQAPPRSDRPRWDDDGGTSSTGVLDQMPQHPPLYYGAMAGVLRVERAVAGGPISLAGELALLRLVNVLLVIPLPALAWAAARRLGAPGPVAELAALAPLGIPQLTAIAAGLNNDNLLILLAAMAAVLAAGVAVGDRRMRTAVALAVVVAAALLTKVFAVVLVPMVIAAYLVGARARPGREPAGRGATATLLLAGAVLPTAPLAAWMVRVHSRTGSWAPSVDARRYDASLRPPGFHASPADFVPRFAGRLSERFWGSLGWYTTRLPGPVTLGLTVATLALVVLGLMAGFRRRDAERDPDPVGDRLGGTRRIGPGLVVLLVPAGGLLLLVAARAWALYARSGQYPFIQGRYLFPGLVGLAVAGAVGVGWVTGIDGPQVATSRLRAVVVTAAVGALAVQGLAGYRAFTTYWGAPDASAGQRLAAMGDWSGLPASAPSILVLVALAAIVGVLAAAATTSRVSATSLDRSDRGSEGRRGDHDGSTPPVPSPAR